MGSLKIKAEEILKVRQREREEDLKNREKSLENLINSEKDISKKIFKDRIQKEINNFQFNLLDAADKGETLKIEILEVDKGSILEKSNHNSIKSVITYMPISQKVVTFLDDTNFDLVSDDIITDDSLQALYDLICSNDIYPQWKVRKSNNEKASMILYLEVDPLVGFKEKEAEFRKKLETRKKIEQHALVLYSKNVEEIEKKNKKSKVQELLLFFLLTLYVSVVVLTVVSATLGVFPIEEMINSFGLVAVAWPYYLLINKSMFVFSFPIGLLIALFFAFRRI